MGGPRHAHTQRHQKARGTKELSPPHALIAYIQLPPPRLYFVSNFYLAKPLATATIRITKKRYYHI